MRNQSSRGNDAVKEKKSEVEYTPSSLDINLSIHRMLRSVEDFGKSRVFETPGAPENVILSKFQLRFKRNQSRDFKRFR